MSLVLTGVLVFPAGLVHGQAPGRGQATLVGIKQSDQVGSKSAYPNGKADAVFSLALNPQPSEPNITEIEIRTTTGPSGVWSSNPRTPNVGYIGVAGAKNPSVILNPQGGRLDLPPSQNRDLVLFVTDDGHFRRKDRAYQLKVTQADGIGWSTPVRLEAAARAESSPEPGAATYPVRMSAILRGLSSYDAVGPAKEIKGDNKADGLFVLTVEAKDKEITAIQIKNVDGTASEWDTVPGTKNWAIGVALASDPARLLNNRDGTVRIRVKDRVDLNLYVADNGSIEKGGTNYRITANFSDGGISWCPVRRVAEEPTEPAKADSRTALTVNFLATWLGFVSTDAVGPYPELKPDGKADAVFGLDVEVIPKGEITGIEIHSLTTPDRKWGTRGTSPGAWGLGVTYQSAPRVLLNKADGSVRIPVEKREQLYVFAADPGDLASATQRLRMVVHLADGSSYQQYVRRPMAATPTVMPESTEQPKARGLMTCEFRGFIADLVNASTRPGKDGYLDGTFITKLKIEDKILTRVAIRGPDGNVRWASDPKAPAMFLGVALYPKIYELVNAKAGPLHIPVSGRKTIYLYAADNGLLSDPNSRLTVEVTFSDKTALSAEVIK